MYIVKNDKIVERISEFEYKNYDEMKEKILLKENTNPNFNFWDFSKFMIGF